MSFTGWRTFQPRTFQPQASTPDLSTPDLSTPDFSTMNFSTPDISTMLKCLGLKGPALKLGVDKSRVEMSFNRNKNCCPVWQTRTTFHFFHFGNLSFTASVGSFFATRSLKTVLWLVDSWLALLDKSHCTSRVNGIFFTHYYHRFSLRGHPWITSTFCLTFWPLPTHSLGPKILGIIQQE